MWHTLVTNAGAGEWQAAHNGTSDRHVCCGNIVFGGRAPTDGENEYASWSEPGLNALSPSRGGVAIAPHVAYGFLAANGALTSPNTQTCS
jgi:hypothetical protein